MAGADFGVTAAAAAPATTTVRAKMRRASFMIGNPFVNRICQETDPPYPKMVSDKSD
jgi:hypothetical protein